ncbi:MAG TPA: SufD family Fe-S cluster assembly protein, partial [Hydrogenophilus thermoluteolus]|nr:SufD family Fe-S cluster assembly protein [Hydrogenophilus thermoluteolus]
MNASTVIAQPLVAQLETYRPTLPESVAERQRAACARFLSRGFPVRRDEEWKYTSVQGIANRAFTLPDVGEALPQTTPTELEWPHGETRQWRFVDGRLVAAPDEPPEGVTALPLAVALTDPFWQERFAAFATSEHSSFVDLNTALASGGLCLRITAPVAMPLEIVWQVSAGVAGEGASIPLAVHPRLLVVVEAGASATLIEHAIGDAASSHFVNAVSEITLARNAQLTHYVVQELPAAVQQIATHAVAVDANACYRSF